MTPLARLLRLLPLVAMLLSVGTARAQTVLKMASVVPDGSPLAREMDAYARDVDRRTHSRVRIKWYKNAVAGGELDMLDRLRRGQLDGVGGAMLCEKVMPTMRVLRLPGLFRSREEAMAVMNGLQPEMEREAAAAGLVSVGAASIGPDVILTRQPVDSFEKLKHVRLWRWDLDEVAVAVARSMGLDIVVTKLEDAARAYDDGKTDGFFAVPSAALAFQWSVQAHYLIDIRLTYLFGCFLYSQRSFDALSTEDQSQVRTAAAQMRARVHQTGELLDERLLGGALSAHGVRPIALSARFRDDYVAAARAAGERIAAQVIPATLRARVQQLIEQYRSSSAPR